jgi:Obg family GTPase CgtA
MPKYGGIGGQGGAVFFRAKEKATLKNIWKSNPTRELYAKNGEDSSKNRLVGSRGRDKEVEVPIGVTVIDEESGKKIGELNHENQTCLVAGGGAGGCSGNNFIGFPGQKRSIVLDLKIIADVGLVGFPNAGKSTLLKAISNAKPKIASYPFTTIMPQIGVLDYEDYRQITISDLPGLIENAHKNVGMGHQFLKHVERTRLLMLIVDINGFQLSQKHVNRNCLENVYSLNKELELYDDNLLEKPSILLVNKMDLDGSVERFMKFEDDLNDLSLGIEQIPEEIRPTKLLSFERVIPISAKCNTEIDKVKTEIREVIDLVEKRKRHEMEEGDYVHEKLRRKLREHGPKIV